MSCEDITGLGKYQYLAYAVLGAGVLASEALGLTDRVKPNTICQAVVAVFKYFSSRKPQSTSSVLGAGAAVPPVAPA